MFDTLSAQIGAIFVVIVCAFAFLRGDKPERIASGAYILCWFASLLTQDSRSFYRADYAMFTVDVFLLIVLAALSWKSKRNWPVWASALQLLVVMSHVVAFVDKKPPVFSILAAINLAGYGVLVAIAVGTFWAWQDRRAASGKS